MSWAQGTLPVWSTGEPIQCALRACSSGNTLSCFDNALLLLPALSGTPRWLNAPCMGADILTFALPGSIPNFLFY